MKKSIKIFALLLVTSTSALSSKAQFVAGYSAGYGAYKMDDLKKMLDYALVSLQVQYSEIPFAIVDNFPGYLTHAVDFGYRTKSHEITVRGMYLTTGGKIAYSDYTGEYEIKLTLNGYRIGVNYRFYHPVAQFKKAGSLSFFAEVSPAITFSKLKSDEYIRILDQSQRFDDAIDLDVAGFAILPQIGMKWNIMPLVGLHAGMGYDFQTGSELETNLKADWSGFRANMGVAVSFGK